MKNAFTLHEKQGGLARLVFDLPDEKVNKLSTAVMQELEKCLTDLKQRTDIKVMSIESGKKDIFIAGADIAELEVITSKEEAIRKSKQGQKIFDLLETLPFPTVAVIDGACLGGGLECALACTYRIATDNKKTLLGCPEVQLGILPGWGGTQRLPRLIGLTSALPMLLSGQPVKASCACRLKLVDAIVAHEFVEQKVQEFMAACLNKQEAERMLKARRKKALILKILERTPLGRMLVFSKARKDVWHKTRGQYPAPLSVLDLVRHTSSGSAASGLKAEAAAFGDLAVTPICKNLIQLFYTNEALRKDPGIKDKLEVPAISAAGVLGAGVMGGGISWLLSSGDISVRMKDVNWEALGKGFAEAASYYRQLTKRRKLTDDASNVKMHGISGTLDYSGFQKVDVVIEAIVENIDIKKKVFAELEGVIKTNTTLCSNTSALSIDDMAADLEHPERLVGMHFFNPVNRMPLVEVIPGKKTSPIHVASICALAKRLKKTPIVVQDCAGFLVNRILLPYMMESIFMCEEGGDFVSIDKLFLEFGMPMGPFSLADEVGLDIGHKVSAILSGAYASRMSTSELLRMLYEDDHLLGKKTGEGFYVHKGKKKEPNPKVRQRITDLQKERGVQPASLSEDDMLDRGILIMLNEAARCMEEKVVEKASYLDMALIMGIGFPPWRGGLLRYADTRGIQACASRLDQLADRYGDKYRPCNMLTDMAANNTTFYE